MLNEGNIKKELDVFGFSSPKIVFYDSTDSTNTRAKEYAKSHSNDKNTVIFIANEQTVGRGRRGRSFVSRKNAGIYLTILSYPNKVGFDATRVTAETAVFLSRAIESLCECKIGIKWVNDLYLEGKKLAGILTECELTNDGKIAYQVVGMGINVYKNAISDEISGIATSLEHHTNCVPDRSKLVAKIITELLSEGSDLYEEYKSRSTIIGKTVTVIKLTESYEVKVVDINPDFSLQIERDGKQERLFTGEISLKI